MQSVETVKAVGTQGISVRHVEQRECADFKMLMQKHHYLGSLPKIGETIWYIATLHGEWIALLSFSTAALKCSARDQWIGWNFRHQYDRLHLITNNSRFLILPDWHLPNFASLLLFRYSYKLGLALQHWNEVYGDKDESLAIDGKTMCGAVDKNGLQTHIMSAVGHNTMNCYAQKK